jgi:hypothetical protein
MTLTFATADARKINMKFCTPTLPIKSQRKDTVKKEPLSNLDLPCRNYPSESTEFLYRPPFPAMSFSYLHPKRLNSKTLLVG